MKMKRFSFIKREPLSEKYIFTYGGGAEFIKNIRYCLWLKDLNPNELKLMPIVKEKIDSVRDFRFFK